jgi:hypothetical protein
MVDFQGGSKEGATLTPRPCPFLHYFLVLPKRRINSCNYVVIKKGKRKERKKDKKNDKIK